MLMHIESRDKSFVTCNRPAILLYFLYSDE